MAEKELTFSESEFYPLNIYLSMALLPCLLICFLVELVGGKKNVNVNFVAWLNILPVGNDIAFQFTRYFRRNEWITNVMERGFITEFDKILLE